MKSIKRLVLGTVFAICIIFLVACAGATTKDNGTYVYEPAKSLVKNLLEKQQGASSEQLDQVMDQITFKMSLEIKDTQAKMTILAEAFGNKKEQTFDLKANQNNRTLESEKGGKDKVKYSIEGDALILDVSKLDSTDKETLALFKDAKFIKVK